VVRGRWCVKVCVMRQEEGGRKGTVGCGRQCAWHVWHPRRCVGGSHGRERHRRETVEGGWK